MEKDLIVEIDKFLMDGAGRDGRHYIRVAGERPGP